jgi:bifunctional UDP-N-acetylglucosamine pyrophosphorylase/glucosamine-1-phosphate N-acetyltransferase
MQKLNDNLTAIVLAAGQGTRMKSSWPKVLHEILGRPMIAYLLDTLREVGVQDILVAVGYEADTVRAALKDYPARFVVQEPQRGTGHAVQVAMTAVPESTRTVLVLCGDAPLISADSILELNRLHDRAGAAVTVQTIELADGAHYGRVVRDEAGRVTAVVQAKDAKERPEILAIGEINTGAYCFEAPFLRGALKRLEPSPVTGEIYLTDMIQIAREQGRGVEALVDPDRGNLLGINSRQELAAATQWLKHRINDRHMSRGVTLMDPESTYIGPLVTIGRDTVIYPDCYLLGRTVIGENCRLEPQVKITDSSLADGVEVRMCTVITESRLGAGVVVGPFAHLRPLSDLKAGARVGNFVEVKKSVLHEGVKANHLTYIGDADIGAGTNVGAGTITCNYDGVNKHKTIIGEGVFIGSNTALVAPVTIGAGALVGAGSTITKDVPPGKMAISRARQVNLERKVIAKKKATQPPAEPLNARNLASALDNLCPGCNPEETGELLGLLVSRGVETVSALLEVATPQNLEMIKHMIRCGGKDPEPFEIVANLANLAPCCPPKKPGPGG